MAWRSARHHLDERVPAKGMLDVGEDIAGLHAQVMSSAELTLAAPVEGAGAGEARCGVVGDSAGLHAKVMFSAELTLAARVEGVAPDDVRRALWEERSLVKTWAIRGTRHLLPAAELRLYGRR